MPRSSSEGPSEDFQARVREAVASLLEDSRKMRAHVQERVEQMSQRDPEREAKALAGRVAEPDKKPSHAQDLATDGLISAHDLREKATAMRAERECAVRKLENLKDDRENIEALKKRSKNALVACAFALHSGLRYFSAEDYQGIYK